MDLSLLYFPSAVLLGALHALEPGHAKTLTAAYLIGTKGTKRDAILLGLSVAVTHSIVVIGLCVIAVLVGREAFTGEASKYLSIGSSVLVIALGGWLLFRRLRGLRRARIALSKIGPSFTAPVTISKTGEQFTSSFKSLSNTSKKLQPLSVHRSQVDEMDHSLLSDEEHARAHAATLPEYVLRGERPSTFQVIAFGAAGGLVPCPAAISVMLLSLSIHQNTKGILLVFGFGIGLAITLVGVGLLVVAGITKFASTGRFSKYTAYAPSIAAALVIVSGAVGLLAGLL